MRPAAIWGGGDCLARKTMRTIKATFNISEDSNNAGVKFYGEKGKVVQWEDLSRTEQIKMLNAWAGMLDLFSRFVKEEEK